MKLSEIRESYENGTSAANSINRQLIFSGIAIIWILKGGVQTSISGIPHLLLIALILLASSLVCDIVQSLVHTAIWYCRYKSFKDKELSNSENKNGLNEDTITVDEKESWSIPTWILWGLKSF